MNKKVVTQNPLVLDAQATDFTVPKKSSERFFFLTGP